ncbi:class 1 isoprenoid biosynthesis enzyme [Cohnella sp. WQ 127256]|uniref:class 1 isoprenoid biosynthesis enzyme n=1 Tax=Cohnella sp. WQ 127256 TaxID=2938790 RepID=UPI0021181576|nr:class 1 isoprenoid biosynthesis enzyme [Cohnella sp. WQ 127256]
MDWINEEYKSEIELIFAEAASEISQLPMPLNEQGLAMLAKFNPLQSDTGTNYICFLLPEWLKEQTASTERLCRDLAIGNVFAMLHYFLLDDVMDEGAGFHRAEVRSSLVLSQLLQDLFRQRYHRHLPVDSPFWVYYQSYIVDWASAVSQEGTQLAEPDDPGQLARKSAPVKLCVAGMLLLSGQQELIPDLEKAIDLVLATLQLSDDWVDWQGDLADEEKCNAFLTLVRQQLSLSPEQLLDERRVKQAIYHHSCLVRLAEIAEDYGERLKVIPNVPAVLIAFHDEMAKVIRSDASAVEETVNNLASGGGLSYFLASKEER